MYVDRISIHYLQIRKHYDDYTKEATDEEVTKFLASPFINIQNSFKSNDVGVLNRKRIANAIDVLDSLSKNDRDKILEYTAEYSNLKYENNASIILEIGNNLNYSSRIKCSHKSQFKDVLL